MPPKDDDDPKSTKEVVTKKQKQMLNREELDLSLIAEAFGGLLLEKSQTYSQQSFPGLGRSFDRSTAEADAEQDYERDLRRGYTDPLSGGAPRPRGGPEGRKTFNQLINDMKKSQKGKPLVPRTLPSVPERVRQQRAQQYREAGGGRRGQYLRRTGRLPATSNPAEPKPAPAAAKPVSKLGLNLNFRSINPRTALKVFKGALKGGLAGVALDTIGRAATDYAAKEIIKGIGKATGNENKMRQIKPSLYDLKGPDLEADTAKRLRALRQKEIEALKPIKRGPTIGVMNPLTGKVEQLTQAEYEKRTGRKTSVVAPPAPAAAPAAAPPKTPVIAPPITGIPRGRGGDQTTPGAPQRPKRDKKGDFQFQPPGGLNLYLGRRQNPQ